MVILSIIATNTAGAVSYHVPINASCSASNSNSLESSTENEADVALNLPLAANVEKPVSLELQPALPAHGSAQVNISHIVIHNVAMYMYMCMPL